MKKLENSLNQSQLTESHLDILDNLESLYVKQEFEQMELITGFETRNKYGIFTSDGIEIFVAEEYSEFVSRICLGKYRSMDIRVEDKRGTEVLQIEREVPVYYCLFPFCCFQETFDVFSGGRFIGSVEIDSFLKLSFKVKDEMGKSILMIKGMSCLYWFSSCFKNVEFQIYSIETEEEIGIISKDWTGIVKEVLTDADNFSIVWYDKQVVDVKTKLLCVGALFYIDIFSFESGGSRRTI